MKEIYTIAVECNTFTFYVSLGERAHRVRVKHHTDFSGTVLEADFPNGDTGYWNSTVDAKRCQSEKDCVNTVGKSLLKDWKNI